MISSPWKLTLMTTPETVLVDFGDRIMDEIELQGAKLLTVTPLVRSNDPHLRNGKNAIYTFQLEKQVKAANDEDAAVGILNDVITWAGWDRHALKLERAGMGDRYWRFSQAAVHASRAKGRSVGARMRRINYTITAKKLELILIGP